MHRNSEIFSTFALLAREYRVPGAQFAIADGDDVVACEFGHETPGTSRPLGREDKVPVGSITKALTAALALVLVSDGDLELDQPIVDYVPELRRIPVGRALDGDRSLVTLRQLLSHTAGLPSGADSMTMVSSVRGRVLDGWRQLVPVARPGFGFSYSNFGYVLVGHLIAAVTGMTWWEAMSAILLKPLDIAPVFVVSPTAAPTQPIVTGHSVNLAHDRIRPVAQSLSVMDAPAGALALSASDLVSFGRMLVTGTAGTGGARLIDHSLLAEMRQPAPGAEPYGLADGWGLGLALFRTARGDWVGHDGTADGTACHLRIQPDDGTVVALTTNATTGFALWHTLSAGVFPTGLAAGGRGTGTGRRVPPPAGCTGSYVNGDVEYAVVDQGGDLRLLVDGEPFAELVCYADLAFEVWDFEDGHPQAGRFLRDPDTGRVEMLQLSGRLARKGI